MLDADDYEAMDNKDAETYMTFHGPFRHDRECSNVAIDKSDRVHEFMLGIDRETGYFTYARFDTVDQKYFEKGEITRDTIYKNVIFDETLIGLKSTNVL